METVMCRSIVISGAYDNSTGERCTTEKRNDLLEPEPTTEPMTSSPVYLCHQQQRRSSSLLLR